MTIDYVNTLGAGAGFNTKEIVSALVEAERAPKESRLESKISESEAEIDALSKATSYLKSVQTAADALNDQSDFNKFSVSNSQTTALSVVSDTNASVGSHSITVSSIAREQRTNLNVHGGSDFSSKTQLLNSGTAFNLSIVIGDSSTVSHTVAVDTTTPQGIVDAVNNANIDVTAQLIDKGTAGTNYIIQLVGKSGTDSQFTVTPSVNSMLASDTPSGFTAANASLSVNGVSYTRSTNNIQDIVEGLTFNLNSTTTGAASVTVNQDTAEVEANIRDLITAYNDAKTTIGELTSRELGGALAGDSVFRQTFRSVKNLFINNSSTPGANLRSLSDMGIGINKTGILEISDAKLSDALTTSFSEIRTLFSADTDNQTDIGIADRGISGDISKLIGDLTSATGYLTTQEQYAQDTITDRQEELQELDEKMEKLQERYELQFSRMNVIIDQMNNTRDNLVSSFENLPFTNRDN